MTDLVIGIIALALFLVLVIWGTILWLIVDKRIKERQRGIDSNTPRKKKKKPSEVRR